MLLAGLLADADLPPGVVAVLPGATAAGRRLVEHPGRRQDRVHRQRRRRAARSPRTCGERLARCSLELGGKSAAIVCEDASLERTVAGLRFSSFLNNGQACVAQSRILAPRIALRRSGASTRRRGRRVRRGRSQRSGHRHRPAGVGPPTRPGPRLHRRRRRRGRHAGRRRARSRSTGLTDGHYVRPTVFRDVDNSMRIAREEIFGPVIVVIPYDDIDDAVRIANDSPYGLGGSVWTKDRVRPAWPSPVESAPACSGSTPSHPSSAFPSVVSRPAASAGSTDRRPSTSTSR